MVSYVGIYGFCLFKKKNVVRADVSINIKMYGLKRNSSGERISKEEGNNRLAPSSTSVAGRFGQLSINTQTQSVCSRSEMSCVINFRLGQVIIPSWLSSEVVVHPVCTMTTTSKLA